MCLPIPRKSDIVCHREYLLYHSDVTPLLSNSYKYFLTVLILLFITMFKHRLYEQGDITMAVTQTSVVDPL